MPFLILTKNNSNDDNKHNWFFLHGASNINEARQLAVKHILEARFGEDGWADKLSEADAGFYLQKVIMATWQPFHWIELCAEPHLRITLPIFKAPRNGKRTWAAKNSASMGVDNE